MSRRRMSVVAGALLCVCVLTQSISAAAQSDDKLVLAFYYAWFNMLTWEGALSDKPLQLYHSGDVYAIQRHVREAQQAGIDALVQIWYGPELTDNQTEANFRVLLDQAQYQDLRAAVSVDLNSPFLTGEDEVITALRVLWEDHAQHPAYLWVEGHPVVFFFAQDKLALTTWQDIRAQVDPQHRMLWIAEGPQLEYLQTFDGLYLYSVAWATTPAAVLTHWGEAVRQWNAREKVFRYWVATVMPGYDDLTTGRANAFVRPRENGDYYRACWEGAIRSAADWVVITSFNQWPEGTHIEPSVNYGNFYINLTAELAAEYRGLAIPATATPTAVLPTTTPEMTPAEPGVVITSTATLPVDTPTPTLTPSFTPTATLTPTATPFRLSTPTPLPPLPTALPRVTPTLFTRPSLTPVSPRTLMPVEGVTPKSCPLSPLLLTLLSYGAMYRRRH